MLQEGSDDSMRNAAAALANLAHAHDANKVAIGRTPHSIENLVTVSFRVVQKDAIWRTLLCRKILFTAFGHACLSCYPLACAIDASHK